MLARFLGAVRPGELWADRDFRRLWFGESVSQLGGQITYLALPLAAALLLNASPTEMGVLGALVLLPYLVLSLPIGVWVDRVRRRPILVWSCCAMAGAFLLVPAASMTGNLSMWVLYFAALVSGAGGLLFDVAAQSYLPTLIERRQLVEGNSKLELSRSAAQVVGPGLGGALVTFLSAPIAILVNSVALFVTAFMVLVIGRPEPPPRPGRRPGMGQEMREGLRLVVGNRTLRAIVGTMATYFFFDAMLMAVFILFASRDLGLGAGYIGLVVALGNLGFIAGALVAAPVARWLGLGRALIAAIFSSSCFGLLVPLATPETALPLLVVARLGTSFGLPIFMVNQISLRQSITPDRLLGRLTGTIKFLAVGVAPVGALVGGVVGSALGVQMAVTIAAAGSLISVAWLLFSPVRDLRVAPPAWKPEAAAAAVVEAEIESHVRAAVPVAEQ
ncbi:MAG: MFS transporter [Chloroflexi bacterium]|nr:MFS transporter [Chloroflexota bacterium]